MIDTILFDVDGVILSEERYFDASSLTIWEMIHSKRYLGLKSDEFTPLPEEEKIRNVRSKIFYEDRVLHMIKERGINANWDMVYLTFSCQLIHFLQTISKTDKRAVEQWLSRDIDCDALKQIGKKINALPISPDYTAFIKDFESSPALKQEMLVYLNTVAEEKTGVKTTIFSRNSTLWDICQSAFQEWYLGSSREEKPAVQEGKRGFLADEIPILKPERLAKLLSGLKDKGLILGIGTGRPEIETIEPLQALGLLQYFDRNRIVTAKDVLLTERRFPDQAPLSKPQPFTFVYGKLGKNHTPDEVLAARLPLEGAENILVVGDSPADYYAAKSMGARFAAVLTGLSGQEARPLFEHLGAENILNDVSEVVQLLDQLK